MRYLRYLSYVVRHKFFVCIECWKMGLYWQGIAHDWHKLLPSEFFPYVSQFGGGIQTGRDSTGYYKPEDTGNVAFELAWHKHQKRTWHHWQSWCTPLTGGRVKAYPIPGKYCLEMIADWKGAGRAQGKPDTAAWWATNKDKVIMHPDTFAWFENTMKFIGASDAFREIVEETKRAGSKGLTKGVE